ncbi:MAG: hypothetical protein ACE15C_08760 [Phycisphaerae bacterium]
MGLNRRELLRSACGAGAAALLGPLLRGCSSETAPGGFAGAGLPPEGKRKLIVVLFGGGVRSNETIDDPRHQWVPRLWNDLVPRGTLFTNMRVEGKVVHPNSAGSIMTGHWEYDDIDWSQPVAHPTIFEIYRKARGAPDTAAWAFVYASILANIGHSSAAGFGKEFAANVVEPPTIPRTTAQEMDRIIHIGQTANGPNAAVHAFAQAEELARRDARISTAGLRSDAARKFLDERFAQWKKSPTTTSHDAFLADCAMDAMRRFAPSVMAVCFGEIDCAHYGSWSRYTDAIARTDELTHKLWRTAEDLHEYHGRTLMLILPDHGRQFDTPGSDGWIHHSDFYTNSGADEGCRRVWMLPMGPGVAAGRKIDRPVPITSAAATGLEFLGLSASPGAADAAR